MVAANCSQVYFQYTLTRSDLYANWAHLEKLHLPPKYFAHQYPMEEAFFKKLGSLAFDQAFYLLNKTLRVSVGEVLVFRN